MSHCRASHDIGRALGRLVAGRGGPRDLAQLRDGLIGAAALRAELERKEQRPELLQSLLPKLGGHAELTDRLGAALVEEPPIDSSKGGYISEGYDAALDALRSASSDGRRAIAALEARYREATGVAALKIRHNAVLGYHIEVAARHADRLMAPDSGFTHRQTLAGVVRFNSPDLHEEAARVVEAGGHALAAEAAHLEELTALAVAASDRIGATADAMARIDVAAGNAARAAEGQYCAPSLVEQPCLEIEGGRHPVVEAALAASGERFIANDFSLGPNDRLWLITGPNMGGKSTFLRQAALIVLLAQAGCFVPAARAKIGLVDRLFSRVGASDNLARGRSTFMVEMVETAAILAQATPNSLVILDEIGRGTSTYDGLAIAWAVVEAMHDEVKARTLFATHYHELTRLADRLDALSLHHVRAREWKGDLVLLHELADGPADRSYGIAVARLAGLSPAVVARAKSVLAKLEAGRDATGGIAAGLDDLPLFASAVAPEPEADALRAAVEALAARPAQPARGTGRAVRAQADCRGVGLMAVPRFDLSSDRRAIIDRRLVGDRIAAAPDGRSARSCARLWTTAGPRSRGGWPKRRIAGGWPPHPMHSSPTNWSGWRSTAPRRRPAAMSRSACRWSGWAAPGAAKWRRTATSTCCSWCAEPTRQGVQPLVEATLYALWDLKLKVGHAVRTTDELVALAKDDMSIRTAMLEARWMWGDAALVRRGQCALPQAGRGGQRAGVRRRQAGRARRSATCASATAAIWSSPTSRTARAGLRDLHTLYWIGQYLFGIERPAGTGRGRPAHRRRIRPLRARRALLLVGPLPPPPRRRAGRGTAGLRQPAGRSPRRCATPTGRANRRSSGSCNSISSRPRRSAI